MELVKRSYEEPGTYLQIPPQTTKRGRESSECEARKEIHRREASEGRLLPARALRGRGNHPPSQIGYMHFRYYAGSIGRFSKPDNITGNAMNPQDWNLYSYVHGNPITFSDPTGHGTPAHKLTPAEYSMAFPDSGDTDTDTDNSNSSTSSQSGSNQSDASSSTVTTTPENTQTSQQTSTPDNSQDSQQTSTQQTQQSQQQDQPQNKPDIAAGKTKGPGRGGSPGKGERNMTARPDGTPNPGKGIRPSKEKPGQWEVKNPHTRNWKLKPKGWDPTLKRLQAVGDKAIDFAKEHPLEAGLITAAALVIVLPISEAPAVPVLILAP